MYNISRGVVSKKPLLALLSLYIILCLAGALFLSSLSDDQADYRQGSFIIFSMGEVAAILFIIPLLAINRMDPLLRGNDMAHFLSTPGYPIKITWGLLRYPLLITTIVCLIPALSGLILNNALGSPAPEIIARSFIMILSIALAALAIGFYASTVCKNALSAAGFALLIIILVSTEPIWLGPVINSVANMPLIIPLSLLLNPFVGAASALNFDILRIDPFYQICPIGQLRFQYPGFWSAVLFNLLIALAVFWRFMVGIRRMLAPSI